MEHILSLSYGKDSIACLEACKLLGYPINRVIHAEVWATDTIPAELPPMIEFKEKADRIIKERYGLTVERFAAKREREKLSFVKQFYSVYTKGKNEGKIYGFPIQFGGAWCNSMLKVRPLNSHLRANVLHDSKEKERPSIRGETNRVSDVEKTVVQQQAQSGFSHSGGFSSSSLAQGADTNIVQYLGIAADEPERIERHKDKQGIVLPLVDIGWDEAYCRKWCEENDLLSPIYTNATRGGCWFCHNQGIDQLRLLRKEYPELWELLLKWDWDSPVTFHPDGRTVHDFDLRFYAEDLGLVPADRKFRWKVLDNPDFYKEVDNE